jgi:hypothetical protein
MEFNRFEHPSAHAAKVRSVSKVGSQIKSLIPLHARDVADCARSPKYMQGTSIKGRMKDGNAEGVSGRVAYILLIIS